MWIKGVVRSTLINYLKIIVLAITGYMKFMDAPPTILYVFLATILILIVFYFLLKHEISVFPSRLGEVELREGFFLITTLDIGNKPMSIYEYKLDEVKLLKKGSTFIVIANSDKFGLEERYSFYSINEICDFFKKNEIEVLDANNL
jgi:hypothetical protein